ncbi:MAG: hypothetical protein IJF65_04290 [Clostridia bacterium]|nr:hypothetical protein [Clostridia bacterium]
MCNWLPPLPTLDKAALRWYDLPIQKQEVEWMRKAMMMRMFMAAHRSARAV